MLRRAFEYFVPPAISDRAGLQRFLGAESARLAQHATYEVTRNTLGYYGQWAFNDERFNDAFRVCRWESFAAVLSDMVVLSEGLMRAPAADCGGAPALAEGLGGLFAATLAEYPLPAHRNDGWAPELVVLRARLARAALAAPLGPGEVARVAAARVYDVMPVRSHNPDYDRQVVENAIRFGTIAAYDRLSRRLRAKPVATELARALPVTADALGEPA